MASETVDEWYERTCKPGMSPAARARLGAALSAPIYQLRSDEPAAGVASDGAA